MSVESCWSRGGKYGVTKKQLIRSISKLRQDLDESQRRERDLLDRVTPLSDALDCLWNQDKKERDRKVYRFRVPRKNGTVKYVEYPVWMLEK